MALVPFDDRDGWIWWDGKLVPWRDAQLHVLTHGLHYASAVFEGERGYSGNIFKLREHTERLLKSGRILGFEIPWTAEQIEAACREVLAANSLTEAYVRPIAWRGSEMLAVAAQQTKIHLAIACWAWPNLFGADRMKGVRLGMAHWKRPHPETAPTESKAAGPLHDRHARQARGGGGRLGRRADARLARPGRRGDGRQHLLRDRRRGAHAHARLLPQRHHAAHRDGDRAARTR